MKSILTIIFVALLIITLSFTFSTITKAESNYVTYITNNDGLITANCEIIAYYVSVIADFNDGALILGSEGQTFTKHNEVLDCIDNISGITFSTYGNPHTITYQIYELTEDGKSMYLSDKIVYKNYNGKFINELEIVDDFRSFVYLPVIQG